MTNKAQEVEKDDYRQFHSLNSKQHNAWKHIISRNIAGLYTSDKIREMTVASYIDEQSRRFGEKMSEMLVNTYAKGYNTNNKFYSEKLGAKPPSSSSQPLEPDEHPKARLSESISNYSDKLAEEVNELFSQRKSGQLDARTFATKLDIAVNQNQHSLNKLFQNEARYYGSLAAIDSQADAGIKQYVFVAVMDENTSGGCAKLNGKRFLVKDCEIGVNAPPLHPNCRSVIVPFDEEDYERNKDKVSYDQWLKDYCGKYFDVDYKAPKQEIDDTIPLSRRIKERNLLVGDTTADAAQGLTWHDVLDIVGMFPDPRIDSIVSVAEALLYALEGDNANAALSIAGELLDLDALGKISGKGSVAIKQGAEVADEAFEAGVKGANRTFSRGSTIPEEILKTKPKYSPTVDKWLDNGGEIAVENGKWKYTNAKGTSVTYSKGYPDFKGSGHVKQEVDIGGIKNRSADYNKANKMTGGLEDPVNNMWHHFEDGKSLQEINAEIHKQFTHKGGISIKKGN